MLSITKILRNQPYSRCFYYTTIGRINQNRLLRGNNDFNRSLIIGPVGFSLGVSESGGIDGYVEPILPLSQSVVGKRYRQGIPVGNGLGMVRLNTPDSRPFTHLRTRTGSAPDRYCPAF